MRTLFPDEQLITQSDRHTVTLTTHRICYKAKEWGRSYDQSVMLEHITSCEHYSIRLYWLLIIAGLFLLYSGYLWMEAYYDAYGIGVVIAVIFALAYWLTRSSRIIIGSPSTRMRINVQHMGQEQVLHFINKVEEAKHRRLRLINS